VSKSRRFRFRRNKKHKVRPPTIPEADDHVNTDDDDSQGNEYNSIFGRMQGLNRKTKHRSVAEHDCSFSSTVLLVCVILFITIHLRHVVPRPKTSDQACRAAVPEPGAHYPENQTVSDRMSPQYRQVYIDIRDMFGINSQAPCNR
jgi:hypothetical protein